MRTGRPPVDEKERFLAKVKVMETGCHEWQSVFDRGGYGKFYFRGGQRQAHRVAHILFKGDVPKWMHVMHSCDNRKCVNPDHLSIGTAQDNISDMDNKGRRGTKSSITKSDAEVILSLLASGVSQEKIGAAFGVHQGTVSRIKLGKLKLFKE